MIHVRFGSISLAQLMAANRMPAKKGIRVRIDSENRDCDVDRLHPLTLGGNSGNIGIAFPKSSDYTRAGLIFHYANPHKAGADENQIIFPGVHLIG